MDGQVLPAGREPAGLSALNPEQRAAVLADGHVLVSACPGSGKTRTIEERVSYLLQVDSQARIGGVTFTREAANSLLARVQKRNPGQIGRVVVGTFHSLCIRQLRAAGKRPNWIEEWRAVNFLKRAYQDTPRDPAVTFEIAQQQVQAWKAQLHPLLPASKEDTCRLVYERYQALLTAHNVCDFQDLIIDTVHGMLKGNVAPVPVNYLMVDEFQDTDGLQLAWVQAHIDRGVKVTVVGDDDQSIYSFRFAMGFAGMESFKTTNRALHVCLDTSYRCCPEVLARAADLIEFNAARVPKRLRTENPVSGIVRVLRAPSPTEEAKAACAEIARSIAEDGACGSDWAILARTNAQLEFIEQQIRGAFPYQRIGGQSFWELAGPALYRAVLHSIARQDLLGIDDLLRACGLSEAGAEAMHAAYPDRGAGTLAHFLARVPRLAKADKAIVERVRTEARMWAARGHAGDDGIESTIRGVGHFIKAHAKTRKGDVTDEQRQADEARLFAAGVTLGKLRGPLAARLRLLDQDNRDPAECVRLMTLHAAKGLEYPRVWLLGCVQGVLPSKRADVDEERRLMYVGMTRAMQVLVVSHYSKDGNGAAVEPSEFLEQADLLRPELLLLPGAGAYPSDLYRRP